MGLNITFRDAGHGIVMVGTGTLNAQEIIAAKRALLGEPDRVRMLTHGIFSFTEVTSFNASFEEIRELAGVDEQLALLIPDAIVAVVAPRDHEFGTARMWEALSVGTGWETYVFRAPEPAEEWIRSTLATRETVAAAGRQVERMLQTRLAEMQEEVREYPVPIAGCDAQFNFLLEQRAAVAAEIARLRMVMGKETAPSERPAKLDAFLASCAFLQRGDVEYAWSAPAADTAGEPLTRMSGGTHTA
jgi:chorismate mutase